MLEYLAPGEARSLLKRLADRFPSGQILFDTMSSFAVRSASKNLKDTTGAVHKRAVDDLKEIDGLSPKLKRVTALPLFMVKYAKQLTPGLRVFFKIASFVPRFRKMLTLVRYEF